jgi:hypothetical protein
VRKITEGGDVVVTDCLSGVRIVYDVAIKDANATQEQLVQLASVLIRNHQLEVGQKERERERDLGMGVVLKVNR